MAGSGLVRDSAFTRQQVYKQTIGERTLVVTLKKGSSYAPPSGGASLESIWNGPDACVFSIAPNGVWKKTGASVVDLANRFLNKASSDGRGIQWVTDDAPGASVAYPALSGQLSATFKTAPTEQPLSTQASWMLVQGVRFQVTDEGSNLVEGTPHVEWDFSDEILNVNEVSFTAIRDGVSAPRPKLSLEQTSGPTAGDNNLKVYFADLGENRLGDVGFHGDDWPLSELFRLFDADPPAVTQAAGPELRYFWSEGSVFHQARYPLTHPILKASLEPCRLNPCAPADPSRTMFTFDSTAPPTIESPYALSPNGRPLKMTWGPKSGFHFARSPLAPFAYPAPFGPITLVPGEGRLASKALMCGLSGLEFVSLPSNGAVTFVPGRGAYSPGFHPVIRASKTAITKLKDKATAPKDLLDATHGTTSWVQVNDGKAKYFGQAAHQPYFSDIAFQDDADPVSPEPRPIATAVNEVVKGATNAIFPCGVYGGVFDDAHIDGLNAGQYAATKLEQLEANVLSQARKWQIRAQLPPKKATKWAGEVPPTPSFTNWRDFAVLGGKAPSPQGFLADLDDKSTGKATGAWTSLTLARVKTDATTQDLRTPSDDAKPTYKAVWPALTRALLHDHGFLVADNWKFIAPMLKSPARVAGSLFLLKFRTGVSLSDLMDIPDTWLDADDFLTISTADARTLFTNAVDEANATKPNKGEGEDDPFANFRALVNDPDWQGLLVLKAPIQADASDSESTKKMLELLTLGLPQPAHSDAAGLRAHHVGFDMGHVSKKDNVLEIEETSLFGVVYHKESSKPAHGVNDPEYSYRFRILDLLVEIRHSSVRRFECIAGLEIPVLFGRAVDFLDTSERDDVPRNTLTLRGVYRSHGSRVDSASCVTNRLGSRSSETRALIKSSTR